MQMHQRERYALLANIMAYIEWATHRTHLDRFGKQGLAPIRLANQRNNS